MARRPHRAARRGAPGRHGEGGLSLGHLQLRTRHRVAAAARLWRQRADHPGLHRERRTRRHRVARPRRFGHVRQLFRGQAWRAPARDLDRRARHVHVEPEVGVERAAAEVARLRRSAGNREQRRQGAAPALHPAGEAVRDPADGARHAAPRTRRHGRHRHGRRRRRAREGRLHQEGHHAALARDARHVAPGGLPRRCVCRLQGTRAVGRPRLDVGDQRHRVARPGGELARQPRTRDAGDRAVEAVPGRSDRSVRGGEPGWPQHPVHAASARRRARAVRGTAHLPRHAGGERPQHHVRGRRRAG